MSLKKEVVNRTYSTKSRLKLLHSVGRTGALYGCAARILNKSLEAEIRTTERRMLRMIIGCKRRLPTQSDGGTKLELWPAWVKGATVEAAQLSNWVLKAGSQHVAVANFAGLDVLRSLIETSFFSRMHMSAQPAWSA